MPVRGVSPNSQLNKKQRAALPPPRPLGGDEVPQHRSVHGPVSAHPGSNQPNLSEGQFGPSPHHGMEVGPPRKSAVTGSDKAVKPLSYGQAYAHPNVHGRPTSDRWTYRGALGEGQGPKDAKKMQEHTAPKSLVPDPSGHGQLHGVSLLTSQAVSQASRERGLAPHEGQTLQWNEDRDVAEGRSAPMPRHLPENVNQGQFKLGLR